MQGVRSVHLALCCVCGRSYASSNGTVHRTGTRVGILDEQMFFSVFVLQLYTDISDYRMHLIKCETCLSQSVLSAT